MTEKIKVDGIKEYELRMRNKTKNELERTRAALIADLRSNYWTENTKFYSRNIDYKNRIDNSTRELKVKIGILDKILNDKNRTES